eukprot:4790686-Heterocapsa_arctica.AAC.1
MEILIPMDKGPTIMYIGRLKTEDSNWTYVTDRNIDAAEVRGDQAYDRRSEISHNGRATSGTTLHGIAKNKVRQEFQNQRSQGKRSRSTTRKT